MKINTNVTSKMAQNNLRKTQLEMEQSMDRLSSGLRINSAADDAAGLAISSRMEAKIRGQEVGIRNTNDAISLVTTAESALGSVEDILQRMRELAVQSANGTNTTEDRASLNTEFQQLISEIGHIATSTTFNGLALLNSTASINIQLSDGAGDTMGVPLTQVNAAGLGITKDLTSEANAQDAMGELDAALDAIGEHRANFGAIMNRLQFNVDNITSMSNNLTAAKSRIEDADMAREVSEMTRAKILSESGISMLTQANQNPQQITKLLQN